MEHKKISQDDYLKNAVKEFEKNNNTLVYYAIFETSRVNVVELDMLYVSDEKRDKYKEELVNEEILECTKNFDDDDRKGEIIIT